MCPHVFSDDCIGQLATMLDLEYVDMQGCRGVSAMVRGVVSVWTRPYHAASHDQRVHARVGARACLCTPQAIAHLVYMRAPKRTEMDAPNRLLTYLNARFAAKYVLLRQVIARVLGVAWCRSGRRLLRCAHTPPPPPIV